MTTTTGTQPEGLAFTEPWESGTPSSVTPGRAYPRNPRTHPVVAPYSRGPGRPKKQATVKSPNTAAEPSYQVARQQQSSRSDSSFFGAIIVTRPLAKKGMFHIYHTCTVNPSLINEWLTDNPGQVINEYLNSQLVGPSPSLHADHKRINQVHSITIENKLTKAYLEREYKGISTATWIEPGSGNEFSLSTPTW